MDLRSTDEVQKITISPGHAKLATLSLSNRVTAPNTTGTVQIKMHGGGGGGGGEA